jgi:hypothetical protein
MRRQVPNPMADRKELDNLVFDAIGLSPTERTEIYWAVAELIKQQLNKAKSR